MNIEYYSDLFAHLHTNKRCGKPAPHKAVLLLSVIDLVENGLIDSPQIKLSDELVKAFDNNWKRYLGALTLFTPDICKPFYHMQHEPFWCLREEREAYSSMLAQSAPTLQNTEKKDLPKGSYSVKAMRSAFACAEIDQSLFLLLRNQEARGHLRVVLISTYLQNQPVGGHGFGTLASLSALLYLLAA